MNCNPSDWCPRLTQSTSVVSVACCYLGPIEHFVSDAFAGVHDAVTVQLQGNDRTFIGERKQVAIMQE